MARFTFRHGIARRQEDGLGNPTFLQASGGGAYIDLVVSPDPTIFLIAHFSEDYMITENVSVPQAWGPFISGVDYWIYWDIDQITGELTRGFTLVEPVDTTVEPPSPAIDQHWFDLNDFVMKVWNGAAWVEVVRCFAALYSSGATIVPQPIGSQVGLNIDPTFAGALLFDPENKPIKKFQRNRSGLFITTETPLNAQFSRNANFRVESAIVQAEACEHIPIHYAVGYDGSLGPNRIRLARSDLPEVPAIGIAAEDMALGETRSFITKGYVSNDVDWNWDVLGTQPAGTALFVGLTGELVTDPPTDFSVQRIGTIVDEHTIFVDTREQIEYNNTGNLVPVQINRDTGLLQGADISDGGTPIPPGALEAFGYVHVQSGSSQIWTIVHNFGTDKVLTQVYTPTFEQVFPDNITILDVNTVQIDFFSNQDGVAYLVLFV